jgi:hypothetical protein
MIWVRLEQRKSAYDFSQTLLDDFLVCDASFELATPAV